MTRPAVFFDRDNTLMVSDGYLGDPSKVELVEGAAEAVARAREMGYAAVVFSNQSGVARGMFGEEAVHAVNARLDEMLLDQNPAAVIDRHEFCPFHPDASVEAYRRDSDLRKPGPGMIHQAAAALDLDVSRSWVIGDAPRDIEAGHAAGCRTILVRNAHLPASPAASAELTVEPDVVVDTIAEAIDMVARATAARAEAERAEETAASEETAAAEEAAASEETVAAEKPATPATEQVATRSHSTTPTAALLPETGVAGPIEPAPSMIATAEPLTEPATAVSNPVNEPAASAGPEPAAGDGESSPETMPTPPPAPVSHRSAKRSGDALEALNRLNATAEQILQEVRRQHETPQEEFQVTKLLAGIVQVAALAALFMAYLRRDDPQAFVSTLLVTLALQTLTIALLIMGKQR